MHQPRTSPVTRALLPILVLMSGFCGISYEILYAKLLGNILGNQFVIHATVLLTFLLGIGLGTLYAHRFARRLWAIEGAIGLYALSMALGSQAIDRVLYEWMPGSATSIGACALVSFVLLATPSLLIGCSVPLFAGYYGAIRSRGAFSRAYAFYNFGAALTALGLEFFLLRSMGLRSATVLLAGLNGVVAATLFAMERLEPAPRNAASGRPRFTGPLLGALALAGVASAVFQLLMIKLAEFLFGPFNETFALVLATVLVGLAVGSLLCDRFDLSFRGALYLALAGLILPLASLPAGVTLYASLYPRVAESYALLVLMKLALTLLLMGLPAVGFGATIPALLRTHRDLARESGFLLFVSSLANALGFALMAFVLHRVLDYGPILLAVAAITAAAILVDRRLRWLPAAPAIALLGLAVVCHAALWNETLLYLGHTSFHSRAMLERERQRRVFADRFKGPQDVFAIIEKNGVPYFFINGYVSIPIKGENASEKLVGVISSILSPRLDDALVLGLGSGATAGAVGRIFDRTEVVEINKAVLDNVHRMAEYNFDIVDQPAVEIVHDDAIHYVKTSAGRYSLILNTVTTPLYFSSSKLYTREFLQAVGQRLTPDGVYVTWVDGRIGDRGMDIIIETLVDTFPTCWMYYLDENYFLMTCSMGEIGLNGLEGVRGKEAISRPLRDEFGLVARQLPYSLLSTDLSRLRSPTGAPINTMDRPVLEHEMSRLQSRANLDGFKRRIAGQLDLPALQRVLGRRTPWDPYEFLAFADLRLKHGLLLGRIVEAAVERHLGGLDVAHYVATVAALAEESGSAKAFLSHGQRLLRRNLQPAAHEMLSRAVALDPGLDDANYALARSFTQLERFDLARSYFLRQWDVDRDARVPMRLGETLIGLGRFEEAVEWLERVDDDRRRTEAFPVLVDRAKQELDYRR